MAVGKKVVIKNQTGSQIAAGTRQSGSSGRKMSHEESFWNHSNHWDDSKRLSHRVCVPDAATLHRWGLIQLSTSDHSPHLHTIWLDTINCILCAQTYVVSYLCKHKPIRSLIATKRQLFKAIIWQNQSATITHRYSACVLINGGFASCP